MPPEPDHLFDAVAQQYARARPGYPNALFEYVASLPVVHQHALDLATGNGQAAHPLTRYFDQVTGTDISAAQLAQCASRSDVHWVQARAEQLPFADHSVDVVTVAQAWHWFDGPTVEHEIARVLRPGGAVVIWGYGLPRIRPDIDACVQHYHDHVLGPYWAPARATLLAGYPDFPCHLSPAPAPAFEMSCVWARDQFLDYLDSWSAGIAYRADHGHSPLPALKKKLTQLWPLEQVLTVRWPMVVRAARCT